jgi:hypothetical protein
VDESTRKGVREDVAKGRLEGQDDRVSGVGEYAPTVIIRRECKE